jgi:hypothetical protein
MHLIIPDVQMKHGVRDDHMEWIGNFIAEKRPDVIVQIGDFADMESLNTYHTPREREGKRYVKDLAAVHVRRKSCLRRSPPTTPAEGPSAHARQSRTPHCPLGR